MFFDVLVATIPGEFNWNELVYMPLITGFVTSVIFLMCLYFTRPRLKISEVISERFVNGKTRYTVKVVNKGLFSINEVKASLMLYIPYEADTGPNIRTDEIELIRSEQGKIPNRWQGKQYADFAVLFSTYENIPDLWNAEDENNMRKIVFQISAKHGLSGFSKTKTQIYRHKASHLTKGDFERGLSTKVLRPVEN